MMLAGIILCWMIMVLATPTHSHAPAWHSGLSALACLVCLVLSILAYGSAKGIFIWLAVLSVAGGTKVIAAPLFRGR